ncbi:MAG: acyltransferase [Nitrospira sp.]|nr:acyltransferase [Nitrospira sp.]
MARRMASIECFRVVAMFAVILTHSNFVANLSQLADGHFLVILSGYLVWWVGVPYFLITAGYFFRQSILADGKPVAQFRRYAVPLAWSLLGWMCIYIVTPPDWPAEVFHHGWWQPFYAQALKNMDLLAAKNISLFLEGGRPVWHLWFLPALMFSLATLTVVTICRLERYLISLIISLYLLILTEEIAGGDLFNFPTHLHLGSWLTATLFTAIGWWLAGREPRSVAMACSLIVGGYVIALMEGTVMATALPSSRLAIQDHHFLGGVILSIGIFMLAIARPTWGQSTPFPLLAQFTLGVYLSHIFVLYTVRGPVNILIGNGIPLRGALVAVTVYIISVLFTVALMRIPILRYLVVKPAGWHKRKVSQDALSSLDHSGNPIAVTGNRFKEGV